MSVEERIASIETEIKWIKREIEELRRDVNRSRWELVGGIVVVVLLNLLFRIVMG
ncbi:MAG: hypothetical protein QXW98_04640 [Candidatus Caldarchaeum sp.]